MASKSAARRAWRVARGNVDPRCDYCGEDTFENVHENHPRRATVEDIVPLSKGGRNNRSNWALACACCNQAKGAEERYPARIVTVKTSHAVRDWKGKHGRLSRRAPVSQRLIDRCIAEDQARRDRASALGFSLYTPIPGVHDEAFR